MDAVLPCCIWTTEDGMENGSPIFTAEMKTWRPVEFLKHLNSMMKKMYPDVLMIAEGVHCLGPW